MCKFETNFTVLDNIVAMNLDVSLWTGRKKLEAQDFGGVELPPKDLASLGSKRIADPEKLKVFSTLKCRAASFLDKHAVRFMGGWGVPVAKLGMVIDELVKIRTEFEQEKTAFLADYDNSLGDWINTHSEWSGIIRNSTVSSDYVRARLAFKWQAFRVNPVMEHESPTAVMEAGLAEEIDGIADTLYGEIAHAAKEMWTRVFDGRTEVTQKALSPLRTLRGKLEGLTFVEPHVCYVVDIIDGALKRMPDKGIIKGTDLLLLHGLVHLLQDGDELLRQSHQIVDGYGPATVLDALLQQVASVPQHRDPDNSDEQDHGNKDGVIDNPSVVPPQSAPGTGGRPMPMVPPVVTQRIPSLGLF